MIERTMPDTAPALTARRNLRVLMFAQAFLGAQLPVSFILGGLAGNVLASNKCFATLPISLIVFGSMTTAPWLSAFMQKRGRRAGFVLGTLAAALGAGLSALALWIQSFPLFLLASYFIGVFQSTQGFLRFAATDGLSEAERPRAISLVLAAGLVPAVLGPWIVKLTGDALAPVPFAGAYATSFVISLAGVWIFALYRPLPPPGTTDGGRVRTRRELLREPGILTAMLCAMVAYALMNLVMTSTPLAMAGCGFETAYAADVVSAHVLAMFAPSFFTGLLITRFGVERIVGAGLIILALAGAVALAGVTLPHFYVALILLGLGWNFGFVGGTTLLARYHSPAERGVVQGMNDFAVFGMVTLASLSSGGLLNCSGGDAVQGWHLVNLAMAPFLALAGGALVWFTLRARFAR
jgi:MFS family permease